jgi:hypothetical protein
MPWLRRWLALGAPMSAASPEAAAAAALDWQAAENALVARVADALDARAANHPGERLGALCLACVAERGEVQVHADAKVDPARDWTIDAWPRVEIRNQTAEVARAWSTIEAAMQAHVRSMHGADRDARLAALREAFMTMACRALLRVAHDLSATGRQAPGFEALCVERGDTTASARARRDRITGAGARGGWTGT